MISILIILAILAAGAFLAAYWKNICMWIKKAVEKIKEVLGITIQGTRTFIMKTKEGLQNKSKYYHEDKLTGEWQETVYTKMVEESEIPPEILAKVRVQKIDIEIQTTEELKLVLNA